MATDAQHVERGEKCSTQQFNQELGTCFLKYGNEFSRQLRAPWRGAGSLAGGSLRSPPVIIKHTNAPRQGRGEILQPLPGCVSLFLFYRGVRFAHPRLISFRPVGAEYVTVFTKSC